MVDATIGLIFPVQRCRIGADGRAFSQHARAHNISARGALLCGIEHDLKIGDTEGRFAAMLDKPPASNPRLARLLRTGAPWDK